jgi:sugar fermentation stimulation protein A
MLFPSPLLRGRLVQRYKRFLADVVLDTGETVTATCPNTGSMKGLTEPGSIVWLSTSDSTTRKYKYTWEMIENDLGAGPTLVGINTGHPNKILTEAIEVGKIAPLAGYASLKREQKYGKNSRIDILLQDEAKGTCYVEIKNVHLMRKSGLAEFPDSVTERGAKHLGELADMVREGKRAVMVFLVQRGDAERVSLARDIDKVYGAAFDAAIGAGVEAIAVRCRLTQAEIAVDGLVEIAEKSMGR